MKASDFSRRSFLHRIAVGAAITRAAFCEAAQSQNLTTPAGPFTLPPLPYAFDVLEPYIDATTMEIHHDKHHQAYVTNLNKAIATHPEVWQTAGGNAGDESVFTPRRHSHRSAQQRWWPRKS